MRHHRDSRQAPRNLGLAFAAIATVAIFGSAQAATWCVVPPPSPPPGCVSAIQAAIDGAAAGDTITVAAGTYVEGAVWITKRLTLLGFQAGVDARGRSGAAGTESVIVPRNTDVPVVVLGADAAGTVIDGFTLSGGNLSIQNPGPGIGSNDGLRIANNRIVGFWGGGIGLAAPGADVTIDRNFIDGSAQTVMDTWLVGLHMDVRFDGLWLINNEFTKGGTPRSIGFIVSGYRQIGRSATRSPLIRGNTFRELFAGIVFDNAFEYAEISGNTFRGNRCVAFQGAPANTLIANNTFIDNMSGAIGLGLPLPDGYAGDPSQWGAHHNTITGNLILGNGNTSPPICGGQAMQFNTGQAPGTITTNEVHGNTIADNSVGAWYEGDETIDISANYWGASSGPFHWVRNPAGAGDMVMDQQVFPPGTGPGRLVFEPWLDSSPVPLPSATTWCVPSTLALPDCTAWAPTIRDAIRAAVPNDTIRVDAGEYVEGAVWVNKTLRLLGAQAGVDARGRVGAESIITPTTAPNMPLMVLTSGSAGTVIDGFTFQGGNLAIQTDAQWPAPVHRLQILNNRISGFWAAGIAIGYPGNDITIDRNYVDGSSITHPDMVVSVRANGPYHGLWLTNNEIVNGRTWAMGFNVPDPNAQVGASGTRWPLITGNTFSGNNLGANLGQHFAYGEVTDNSFLGNSGNGLQGALASTLVARNVFQDNAGNGADLSTGATDSVITDNLFVRNGLGGMNARLLSTLVAGNTFDSNAGNAIMVLGSWTSTFNTITGNTIVKNGMGGIAGLMADTAVIDNRITGNGQLAQPPNVPAALQVGQRMVVKGNTLADNRGFALAFRADVDGATVTGNVISHNGNFTTCPVAHPSIPNPPGACGGGISFSSFDATQTSNVVRENTIADNRVGAVYIGPNATTTKDVRENSWGTPSGPFHATRNPAGSGNAVVDQSSDPANPNPGMILFDPWIGTGYTPAGTNVDLDVTAALPDGSTAWVGVGFDQVEAPGRTTVTTAAAGPAPSSGFQLGKPPVYYDVTTTATFVGNVEVCFTWMEGQFHSEKAIRLHHYKSNAWVDVTTSVDTLGNVACGQVTSLSAFVLVEGYDFGGFLQPVANPPTLNVVRAGQSVSVKFSLGGYRGLDIFYPGYPASGYIGCGEPITPVTVEPTITAGTSGLQYDGARDEYTYVWKTMPSWAKTCRALVINFMDGGQRTAYFQFRQ